MRIGYARVSKAQDQDTAARLRALKDAGAIRVFAEHASGGRWDRPELHLMEKIEAAGAGFRSLTEAIDTTPVSWLMM